MTRAPYVQLKAEGPYDRGIARAGRHHARLAVRQPELAERHYPYSMGETAENVAERWGVSRERQDAFALESQQRAVAAIDARAVRRPDRPRDRPDPQGRPGRGRARRAPASGHLARGAGPAPTGVQAGGRHGHGRQQLGHQRRRLGGAGRGGRTGPRAGAHAHGPGHLDGGRRGRSGGHGRRAGAGLAQGARAGRDHGRRPRPHRAQRGLRLAVAGVHRRAGARPGARSTSTAARSRSGTRSA